MSDLKMSDVFNLPVSPAGLFHTLSMIEVKGKNAHELFKWAKENHGKSAEPKWNFHKILIDKEGKVVNSYSSLTKPKSEKLIKIIEEKIKG